ncbi:MAG: hypothetical protein U0892_12165 [Pirellulales bacterium]
MHKREQNYMFAYNLVPAFLFRSDFAKLAALAHPHGFLFFQKYWERLAEILPKEHVVSSDPLVTETYRLSEGIYCLIVTMPPTERYLEVQYLGIVFQPKVRYFVAGRNDLPGMGSRQTWTLREVTPEGHGICGMLREATPEQFLNQVARAMQIEPDIRIASGEEVRESAESIETFPAAFQMVSPDVVLGIAATYRIISLKEGDTTGIPSAAIQQFYEQGGEPLQRAIATILRDPRLNDLEQHAPKPKAETKKRWWQIWK